MAGLEVDVLWPAQRLIVEVDGYEFHGPRPAFERDRRRDGRLLAAGYRVLRVTWLELVERPERVLATIVAALGNSSGDHRKLRHARMTTQTHRRITTRVLGDTVGFPVRRPAPVCGAPGRAGPFSGIS